MGLAHNRDILSMFAINGLRLNALLRQNNNILFKYTKALREIIFHCLQLVVFACYSLKKPK